MRKRTVWRWVLIPIMLLGSCAGLFRVSWRLADPLANGPFDPGRPIDVLLVWPDRIEIRRVEHTSMISPRPPDAAYRFLIPPERRASVEGEVARYPSPNTDASWKVQVRDLGPERQRIQLELFGDGIRGTVYEATARGILPLHTRLTGPGFAFTVAEIHFALWSVPWLLVYLAIRIWRRRARVRVRVDVQPER